MNVMAPSIEITTQINDVAEEVAFRIPPDKPRLLVEDASPDSTVASLRDVLANTAGLYDRGTPVRLHRSALEQAMKVHVLRPDDLVFFAHQVCRPYTIRTKGEETREVDVRLPRAFADMYLGWQGAWELPVLNGIACSPLLRDNGSFHAVDGYDIASGLWCERVPEVGGLIPANPTMADATAALGVLRETFRSFCFADAETRFDALIGVEVVDTRCAPGMDESSALAALITAVCRASLPLAPGVLIRAAAMSGAGAGKGLLARCIAIIAFGQEPHAVSAGSNREELEKRIASELMEAGPALFLDNLNSRTFKSDLLASVLTERPARVRILGRSQMVPLNSAALIILTGNGLILSEDLTRRFLVVELDPRTEDPELRTFRTDIKATCREQRAELLAAVLTIWRWGRLADDMVHGSPFGSFESWSLWVRDPLLALGCKDPVTRISDTKSRDGERQQIKEFFEIWWRMHRDRPLHAKDLAEELRHALDPQARGRQFIANRLEKLTGTRVAGHVLERQPPAGKWSVASYVLKPTDETNRPSGFQVAPGSGDPPPGTPYDPYDPYAFAGRRQIEDPLDQAGRAECHKVEGASSPIDLTREAETHRDHRGHRGVADEVSQLKPLDGVETPTADPDAAPKRWGMRL